MTIDSRIALEAAALLDKAADRVDTFGWYVGAGWYAHNAPWLRLYRPVPPTQRPAWGQTHIYFAAGVPIPHWNTAPETTPPTVGEALAGLAEFLISRGEERAEDRDGYIDAGVQVENFEASDGMTADEVAETMRDCAASIRAKHTTPAEKSEAA